MKQRFGGLLCLLLGGIFLAGGTLGGTDAGGGVPALGCGILPQVGAVIPVCRTGTIAITETTSGDGTPPATWTVTITSSNCTLPDGTSDTVAVPNNGSVSTGDLYQNVSGDGSEACSYTLAETPVAGFTASFTPAGPYLLPQTSDLSTTTVALKNVGAAAATPTPTPTRVTTPTPSPSATTGGGGGGGVATPTPIQVTGVQVLPRTGQSHGLAQSLTGVGLLALGGVLLLAGRRRTSP